MKNKIEVFKENEKNEKTLVKIWNFSEKINEIIWKDIFCILDDFEKKLKGFSYNRVFVSKILEKISIEDFEKIFLNEKNPYNKNILMFWEEIIYYLDFSTINSWTDLVEFLIKKIWLTKQEFDEKVLKNIKNQLFFPNLSNTDIAQNYCYKKLQELLPNTEIIFWNEEKILQKTNEKTVKSDSVWFLDFFPSDTLNLCLFKLLKTEANDEKKQILQEIFKDIKKDIFIWWNTFSLPFSVPEDYFVVNFPKTQNKWDLKLFNWILLNSMWYLNSAYYLENVKWSFVLWSHNIGEPLHSGKLTIINNSLENKFNHNWILSYFWEKSWLICYSLEKWQEEINKFLSQTNIQIFNKNQNFQKYYQEEILPLFYGIFYKFLEKNNFLK